MEWAAGSLRERFLHDIPSVEMIQFGSCWSSWFCLGIWSVTFQLTVLLLGIINTKLIKTHLKKKTASKAFSVLHALIIRDLGCLYNDFYASQAKRNKDLPSDCCADLGLGFIFLIGRGGVVTAIDFPSHPLIPSFCFFYFSRTTATQLFVEQKHTHGHTHMAL